MVVVVAPPIVVDVLGRVKAPTTGWTKTAFRWATVDVPLSVGRSDELLKVEDR